MGSANGSLEMQDTGPHRECPKVQAHAHATRLARYARVVERWTADAGRAIGAKDGSRLQPIRVFPGRPLR